MLLGLDQEKLALSTKQKQLLRRIDLEDWLLRQANPAARRMIVRSGAPWTKQDIRDLQRDVLVAFSAASAPVRLPLNPDPIDVDDPHIAVSGPACAVQIVAILGKVIAAMNEGLKAPLPSMGSVSTPRYPKNPFRRDVVTALGRVRYWRKMLPLAITKMGPTDPPSRGLVLLSAALYGGILNTELLWAVARALREAPGTLGLANKHLYLQISVAWRAMQDFTRRTWYPDPLTATLIARLPPSQPETSEEGTNLRAKIRVLRNEVLGALRSAGVDKAHEPRSLFSFLADLRIVSQSQMPSLLAAYAAHDIRAQGLPARTLERIYSVRAAQPVLAAASAQATSRQQTKEKREVEPPGENPQEAEPDWRKPLRKVLRQKELRDARELFDQLLTHGPSNRSATTSLILEFTEDLLSQETGKKKMTTVRPLVRDVLLHIGDALQRSEEDLIGLSQVSSEPLEDIYREALEGIDPADETPSVRKKLADALRAFHNFLVRKHGVKRLEDTSLLSMHGLGSPVDANLVTLEEYHKILDWLDRNWPTSLDPGLQPLARMMVILGFRCGLRRSEALGIKCAAVRGFGSKPELLIQPSSGHSLKSTSAKRRLPISLLMTDQERQEFLALAQQGMYKPDKRSHALLTIAGSYGLEVSSRRLLPIIHEAMRAVTNDPSLKFHHLRHSFATWTMMRLMIGESGNIPEHFRDLSETKSWLKESRDFCTKIYAVLPATTRRHAYLLAQMMGHSHPTVTLQFYVHGMDWLLDTYLRSAPTLQPNTRTVVLASGLRERTAFRLAAQGTAVLPARVLSQRWPELATVTPEMPKEKLSWPWKAWKLVYRHLCLGHDLKRLADYYGFSLDQALGMLRCARYLSQMRARIGRNRGSRGWQHGMLEGPVEPGETRKTRTACPIEPRLGTDTKVVTTFAPALDRTLQEQPDLIPLLRYYADNIWQQHNQLFFRDPNQPSEAIAYLELLERMGIKRSQHRFFVFHKLQDCEQLEQWKVALGLPKNVAIRRLTPPNANSNSYDSWIGIEPYLSSSTPARGNNSTGTNGFRFLMLMAYIVYPDIALVCGDLLQDLDKDPDSPLKGHLHGNYKETYKWGKDRRILPIIKYLLVPSGPLYKKPYSECKRLLIAYLQAVSKSSPKLLGDSKCYSRRKAAKLLRTMQWIPTIMRLCDRHESSEYNRETFTRQFLAMVRLSRDRKERKRVRKRLSNCGTGF